jgi:hypothetical protein
MKNDQHPKPKNDGPKKETTSRHVYIEPGAKIDFVQDLKDKYESAQGDNKTNNNKQLLWTKIAAGLLLLTAGFSGWQGVLTRRSVNDAGAHFVQDERPYIWQAQIKMNQAKPSELLVAHIFFANYGKSPAINRRGRGYIFIGPDAPQKAETWFNSFPQGKLPEDTKDVTQMVVPPGIPSNPDNAPDYTSLHSEKPLTQEEIDAMYKADDYLVVVDHEQYYDFSGNFYWSNMCWSSLTSGIVHFCTRHNEIH